MEKSGECDPTGKSADLQVLAFVAKKTHNDSTKIKFILAHFGITLSIPAHTNAQHRYYIIFEIKWFCVKFE